MYSLNPSESNLLGKIGMLLSGITILVACGGWAIIIDWRLGLVSIALLPALVVGMMFQVTFDKMMMYIERTCWICCLHRTAACPLGWQDLWAILHVCNLYVVLCFCVFCNENNSGVLNIYCRSS